MSENKQKKYRRGMWLVIALIAAVTGAVILFFLRSADPALPGQDSAAATAESGTAAVEASQRETEETPVLELSEELKLSDFGAYTGMFMEDGTNETVSGVMMLVLRNEGAQDLQYVRFSVAAEGELYQFEATNVPAGGRAVLLEQARQNAPDGAVESAEAEHIVFFDTPMDVNTAAIEITGMDGALNVRNVSGADIAGDVYIYYKYAAEDLFYGGITFRAVVSGGLEDGELRQIPTGHYSPESCRIVHVVYGNEG